MSDPVIDPNRKIAAAQAEVDQTREALIDTVRVLQNRFEPNKVMREVWEKAKIKGADLAEEAVDAVTSRPVALGGVAAAIAMFLAREPIKDAAVKIYDGMTSKKATKAPGPALKQPQPPARPSAPAKPRARPAKRRARKTENVQ